MLLDLLALDDPRTDRLTDPLALAEPEIAATVGDTHAAADPLAPFAAWLETLAVPATRRSYARALASLLASTRATYLVAGPDEVTDGMVAAWVAGMREEGRLAPATIRRMRSAARSALGWWRRQREAARLAEIAREQQVCIARLEARLVVYHAAVAGLHAAIQASQPGAVACGCSFVEECHRADCPLQQAAHLLALAA